MNMLFNEHLRRTSAEARFNSAPMLCEDVTENVIVDAITDFANSLSSVSDWLDLGTAFDSWCESNELSDEAISVLQETISEAAEQSYGNADDNSVRGLLKTLAQPFPKATETTPNKDGLTPEAGETSTKRFLAQLRTFKNPDPYGNKSLDADHYKAFDREANRYGYNYSAKRDYNNQTPTYPLANPILNTHSGRTDEAFAAVDAVRMGALVHWRVYNKQTGEYVTRQIHKEQAEQVAAQLNREYQSEVTDLQESVSRKHFEQVAATVKAIEDPQTRQHFADHHASIFAKQNPRFDHVRWHKACNTAHVQKGKLQNESIDPISTGLRAPLNPRYLEAMQSRDNWTMSGSVAQSGHYTNPGLEFQKTAQLIKERQSRFNEQDDDKALTSSKQTVARGVQLNEGKTPSARKTNAKGLLTGVRAFKSKR
jgi:hypothetical protein